MAKRKTHLLAPHVDGSGYYRRETLDREADASTWRFVAAERTAAVDLLHARFPGDVVKLVPWPSGPHTWTAFTS